MVDTTGLRGSRRPDMIPPLALQENYNLNDENDLAPTCRAQGAPGDTARHQATAPRYAIFLPNQRNLTNDPDAWLPQGWKVGNRRRSLLELETNIRTLGELSRTLSDLRSQLPSPIAAAVESQQHPPDRRPSGGRPLADPIPEEAVDTPVVTTPGTLNYFSQQLYLYPAFVFDELIRLYLRCVSYPRLHPVRFQEKYSQGLLHPALLCAIYAFSAVHGSVCHPDQFDQFPFMEQLASDCYRLAHDLVEFDEPSKTTVETLVLLHKYCVATGHMEETLFCLAVRHLECLLDKPEERGCDVDRLQAWMLQQDLALAVRTFAKPVMTIPDMNTLAIRKETNDRRLQLLVAELDGLVHAVRNQASSLEKWRETVHHQFPLDPTKPDARTLRLHLVYFGVKLYIHQRDLFQAQASNDGDVAGNDGWTDYFTQPPSSDAAMRVEKALLECMQAAFGFIDVVRVCFELGERCMILEIMDTLSAAFTVLYFGMKMMPDPQVPCQAALEQLVQAFASSTAMMACVGISQFVIKWQPLISHSVPFAPSHV